MAFISSCGWLGNVVANKFRPPMERITNFGGSKIGMTLDVVDLLIGITGVVLGVLALLKILPLPPSMIDPFAYGAIAAGGLNILISALNRTTIMCAS